MKRKKRANAIGLCTEDRIMYAGVYVLMGLLIVVIAYPLVYVVSCSFSSGNAVSAGRVLLWPVEFSLTGYRIVFNYKQVWTGYYNTIFYTVTATALNVVLTTMAAYPLSRKNFQGRKLCMTLFMVTMFFSGGIIPSYILKTQLHIVNTRWAILLTGSISVYNMVVMRTFFQNSIPGDLLEAARLDGISDIGYLLRIVIPLSKAVFAVITLYYAVAHWNSYFNAMMYLRDRNLYPLQLVLRDILNAANVDLSQISDPEILRQLSGASEVMRYSLIVISTVPMMAAYPIVQKYFKQGVMIGSVKG